MIHSPAEHVEKEVSRDNFFAEYMKCPDCKQYYSYDFVVNHGVHVCPKCNLDLVDAWVEAEVEKEIVALTHMGKHFHGEIAFDSAKARVVGFTWGFAKPLEKIEVLTVRNFARNPSGNALYFSEIATDPCYRQRGIGSELCRAVVAWMQTNYPNTPGYLRTHENSPARRLFQKAGFTFHSYDEIVGGGRIYMTVDYCGYLTPDNLKRG